MTDKAYEVPKLALVGTLEQMTLATGSGNRLDASFPTTTPKGSLTFS